MDRSLDVGAGNAAGLAAMDADSCLDRVSRGAILSAAGIDCCQIAIRKLTEAMERSRDNQSTIHLMAAE